MKTLIKSVFLTAILALVVTGCQKESDDLNVSLKSLIPFDGGYYETNWQSGNAEFECALAGGCDGGSYKIDSGVDAGVYFNEGGVTVTGINKQKFSWTSIYPVCKIIVKAGRGAYIFDIGGLKSGTVPYPTDLDVKEKDISHITFCFGKEPNLVIAFKGYLTSNYATTSGGPGNIDFVGYYDFVPDFKDNKIYYLADMNYPLGYIIVSNVDDDEFWEVTVNNSILSQFLFTEAYLFVGTLDDYFATHYTAFPYKTGVIPPTSSITFDLPF